MPRLTGRAIEKPWGQARPPAGLAPLAPFWRGAGGPIGEIWFEDGTDAPLLLKFLFTAERLSVQVHPDAAYAAAQGLPGGKDEAWFVLDAEPGATIGMGLLGGEPEGGWRAAAEDGRIVDRLEWKPVAAGDVVYVPAGTVHALGGGLALVEIQENVDITFRLHDYGRPRPLHLDEGLAVARSGPGPSVRAAPPPRPGRHLRARGRFVLEQWMGPLDGRLEPEGEPVWLAPLAGSARIGTETLGPGEAIRLDAPAAIALGDGQLLVAHPGGEPRVTLLASGAGTDRPAFATLCES